MPRLVHLSDIHHQLDWESRSYASTGWRGALGRIELHGLGRFAQFSKATARIQQLLAAIETEKPDHVLLTGDLTGLGDEEELVAVRALLAPLIDAGRLTVIPGNHDRYTSHPSSRIFERIFAPQLTSQLPEHASPTGFPFVHFVGDALAVVGLDSTHVCGLSHYFVGRLGDPQLDALARVLADPRMGNRTVLVLSHHGPLGPAGAFHWREAGMIDASKFLQVIHGQRVVVHHGHSHQRYWHPAKDGRPHIFGGGSSTEARTFGYWVIDVEDHLRVEAREVKLTDPELRGSQ